MTQLNNVITSKLTQTKFDTLAQGKDDIERSISLINEGMDLYNNHDAKMSFLQKDICGKDGELAHWVSVFMATKAAFNKTIQGNKAFFNLFHLSQTATSSSKSSNNKLSEPKRS